MKMESVAMQQVTFEIPDHLAEPLHGAFGPDLARAAIEAIAEDGYTSRKLSRYETQQMLGIDNIWDFEKWMTKRDIYMPYSIEDLEVDRANLDRIFQK